MKYEVFKTGDVLELNIKTQLRFVSQETYKICIDELVEATKAFIHKFVEEEYKLHD